MARNLWFSRKRLSRTGRVYRWGMALAAATWVVAAPAACQVPASLAAVPLSPSAATGPVTAIVGATVIDGTGAPPMNDAAVVFQGRHILAVGPQRTVRVPKDADVVDGRGLFVLPGFVDANANGLSGTEVAANALRYGVTTLRPTAGGRAVRDSLRAGYVLGPRVLTSGTILGWGWNEGGAPPRQIDELRALDADSLRDSLRKRVRQFLDTGVDFVKYGATAHGTDEVMFSLAGQQALIEEVHKRGLPVDTHATGIEGLRRAVLAGVDVVQHAEIREDQAGRRDGLPWPDDLVQLMVEHHVICALLPLASFTAGDSIFGEPSDRSMSLNRRKLIRAGCTIAVTTDGRTPLGSGTLRSIESLVTEYGIAPMEALVAATRNGALACKMLDQFGTVSRGKLADLVVLRADPLRDIKNIEQTVMVFMEGRRIDAFP